MTGQQEIQAASDVFLGWARFSPDDGSATDFYFRQLWDGKYRPALGRMSHEQLSAYARLCGVALARAHARSGQPATIAGYLGDGTTFTDAIVAYATAYAKLIRSDHAELVAAVAAAMCPPPWASERRVRWLGGSGQARGDRRLALRHHSRERDPARTGALRPGAPFPTCPTAVHHLCAGER